MKIKKTFAFMMMGAVLVIATLWMPVSTEAQVVLRNQNRLNRGDVERIVARLENSSDRFRRAFDQQMDRNRRPNDDRYVRVVDEFEVAVDRLRREFNNNNASWWQARNQVSEVVREGQDVNVMMNSLSFRRNLEVQWRTMRTDVNTLADIFDLPGLNGGGWQGGNNGGGWQGGGYPGGGNVPLWAAGTFYGRDRQTGSAIALTIARNGSVSVSVDGNSPSYASLNGTTLTNGPYVSRVTRRGNGIRTTDINNRNNFIDYSRNPNNGGGWNPGGGGQGNIPNWAVGSFYGNDSLSGSNLAMTISQNGQVSISIDGGAPISASMNGTTLTNGVDVSRLTRINNGIRTTDVNNRNRFIDYYRR